MFNRLVIVLMLMLFPLQWSAAQGHELKGDAGAFSAVFTTGVEIAQRLTHTDEPGGVCQFHGLSQPAANLSCGTAGRLRARPAEGWSSAFPNHPPGLRAPAEIDKPRWASRQPLAASA